MMSKILNACYPFIESQFQRIPILPLLVNKLLWSDKKRTMAALSFISSVAMGAGSIAKGAKWAAGVAKAAKIARTAEHVRTAGSLISSGASFAQNGNAIF